MFDDKQLVTSLRQGDKQALCRIYERYGDGLLSMAKGIVRDRGLAEDAVHDVFLEFVRNVDSFVLTGKLRNYLGRCVVNRCIDMMRAKDRRTVELQKIRQENPSNVKPQDNAEKNEALVELDKALGQLPPEQRLVIMMHIHGRMGYRQIAKQQGVSVNTVQGRYRYGMRKLKEMLNG